MADVVVQYYHQSGSVGNNALGRSWLSPIPVFDALQAMCEEFPSQGDDVVTADDQYCHAGSR